jgi:hypothetical protein
MYSYGFLKEMICLENTHSCFACWHKLALLKTVMLNVIIIGEQYIK